MIKPKRFRWTLSFTLGFPGDSEGEESACSTGDLGLTSGSGMTSGTPTPLFLPRESHGQRSLVGYSQWGVKELNSTEQLTLTVTVNQTHSESGQWKAEHRFFKKGLKVTGVWDEYPTFLFFQRTNVAKYRNFKDTVFSSLKSVFRAMDLKHKIIKPEKVFFPPKPQNLICNMVTFNR